MPAEELLFMHTPFPYVTAFSSQEMTLRLAADYLYDSDRLSPAISQSVTTGVPVLRYCVACMAEDRHSFGEDYWHRQHNLPFVTRCWKHNLPLAGISLARGTGTFELPGDLSGKPVPLIFSEENHRYIEATSYALLESLERCSASKWQQDYRKLAIERGFPRQGNGLSTRTLNSAFLDFFGKEALNTAKLGLKNQNTSWPACLLRKGETSNVTAKHVLLQVFLRYAPRPTQ